VIRTRSTLPNFLQSGDLRYHRHTFLGGSIEAPARVGRICDVEQTVLHKLLQPGILIAIECSTCSTGGADGLEQIHCFVVHKVDLIYYQAGPRDDFRNFAATKRISP
jgi:hypothetical protein